MKLQEKLIILMPQICICIVAAFFYAAIWTDDTRSLSNHLLDTGMLALIQFPLMMAMLCVSYTLIQDIRRENKKD